MSKNIGKNVSKNLSGKYSQKLLDHTKQSATDALNTVSKKKNHKTVEATGELTDNKITDKIMKVSRILPQTSSEAVKNDHDKKIPKERYISPEERQKIIDDLRLI